MVDPVPEFQIYSRAPTALTKRICDLCTKHHMTAPAAPHLLTASHDTATARTWDCFTQEYWATVPSYHAPLNPSVDDAVLGCPHPYRKTTALAHSEDTTRGNTFAGGS